MTDFLLELRSEEIPARMQKKARQDLRWLFENELTSEGSIAARLIKTYATPRRLVLIAEGLPTQTEAETEEFKGPKVGASEQAIEGFLRKTGADRDELFPREDAKGVATYFVQRQKLGRNTVDVLATILPKIVRGFPWPKSMRWGAASTSTESPRWVRPLQGIVALFGEDIVPIEIAGITSGAATLGHRFHHSGIITIGSAHDYVEKLRACHVIVDQNERMTLIRGRAHALASEAGLVLVEDESLVAENAGLTEWPVPLLGHFDAAFLDVPPEVIQLTARVNQKYFVLKNPPPALAGEGNRPAQPGGGGGSASTLANAFICTANIDATDGGAKIVDGNRKVLAARLADAKFFYDTDLKVPLEVQAEKLGKIVFHEKLGTLADKVDRVAKLARWLVEEGIVTCKPLPFRGGVGGGASNLGAPSMSTPHPNPSPEGEGLSLATLAHRAALLCKADLVTGMVGEFPELQGLMGGYYALAQGEDPQVAEAIRDHYKPVGQGDDVPTAPVTVAVSLADKLDTLFGFFAALERPSGSRDPFALRRAALAALAIVLRNNLRMSLAKALRDWLVAFAIAGMKESFEHAQADRDNVRSEGKTVDYDLRTRGYLRRVIEETTPDEKFPIEHYIFEEVDEGNPVSLDREISFSLDEIEIGRRYSEKDFVHQWPVFDSANNQVKSILIFFADRLKVQQREAGVRHDLIDAVFALGSEDDLVRLLARVHALQAFVGTEDGANLLAGYKRAANILKKEGWTTAPLPPGEGQGASAPRGEGEWDAADVGHPHPSAASPLPPSPGGRGNSLSYTPEPCEAALQAALDSAEPAAARGVEAEDFEAAMAALATLRAPIDAFFDSVTVNDPDAAKRQSRLALLARVRAAVHNVADFSRIEG